MEKLPEELLADILSRINEQDDNATFDPHPTASTTALYALCLTSKRLYRIARPYLYNSVYIHSRSSGGCLLRVLQADTNGDLRKHVRSFSVQHSSFETDDEIDVDDAGYGTVGETREKLTLEILTLLPSVEVVDLSRLVPSQARDPSVPAWLGEVQGAYMLSTSNWHTSTCFASVKRLALHLGSLRAEQIWPVFHLPNLRELELDVRKHERGHSHCWTESHGNWETGTSNIESLRLVALKERGVTYLSHMRAACKAIRHVSVAIQALDMISSIVSRLWPHICSGVLTKLDFVAILPSQSKAKHYNFALLDVHSGVSMDGLYDEMIGMVQDVIMGTHRTTIGEERKYLELAEVEELTELEKKVYDGELFSRP
jgi:hypothetical protein